MRIQLIKHDPEDFFRTNISLGARAKGYRVNQIFICNKEELPPIDSFDWVMETLLNKIEQKFAMNI